MLIGDLIQDCREAVTDLPAKLPTPIGSASVVGAGGSTLAIGNYFVVITQLNAYGETLPTAESGTLGVGANNGIQITSALLPGATAIRAYITLVNGGSGNEQQYVQSATSPFTISSPPTNSGIPPTRSSAYLPDTDGKRINTATMYRWLNRALELASQAAGGLFDYGGFGTLAGSAQYIAPGSWNKISSLWYDGYPLAMDDAGNFFRRNAITASILASVACSLFTERMMLEVWPQPVRTAAATTLANNFNLGDTQAVLTSAAGFLLTNGFVKIGSEICAYNGIVGNTLTNLIRGLAGTTPATQVAAGGAVSELNIFWQGWRMYAPAFVPGNAGLVIPVPVSWNPILFQYVLARAKLAEQSVQEFTSLDDKFKKEMATLNTSNRVHVGPRQVGDQSQGLETYESLGGGWVIP